MTTDPAALRLFEAARALGLEKNSEIARALGVSQSTISRLKSGKRGLGQALRKHIRTRPGFAHFDSEWLFPDTASRKVPA